MFLKSLLFALMLAVSTVSLANTNTLTVGVDSDNVFRGESITEDSVSANLGLRLSDLFLTGFYLRGDLSTTQLTPLSDNVRFRSDVGVGYAVNLAGVTVDGSFNRVLNPVLRDEDYSEARLGLLTDWNVLGFLDFYGNAAYALNGPNDWYVGAGVALNEFLTPRLNLRAGANWHYFDGQGSFNVDNFSRNNWEVAGDFLVWRNVSLTGLYSFGRVGSAGTAIDNEWRVGLRATF